MPAAGHRSGLRRRWGRWWVTGLIWLRRFRCGPSFSGLVRVNTFWWGWCTISPGWALDSPVGAGFGVAYAARAAGGCRRGRRCRCSTSITRCGSGRSSGILMIRAV